jgi:hypothetical protein
VRRTPTSGRRRQATASISELIEKRVAWDGAVCEVRSVCVARRWYFVFLGVVMIILTNSNIRIYVVLFSIIYAQ